MFISNLGSFFTPLGSGSRSMAWKYPRSSRIRIRNTGYILCSSILIPPNFLQMWQDIFVEFISPKDHYMRFKAFYSVSSRTSTFVTKKRKRKKWRKLRSNFAQECIKINLHEAIIYWKSISNPFIIPDQNFSRRLSIGSWVLIYILHIV